MEGVIQRSMRMFKDKFGSESGKETILKRYLAIKYRIKIDLKCLMKRINFY